MLRLSVIICSMFISMSAFAFMTAKEARKIADKNKTEAYSQCTKTAISNLKNYIPKSAKEGQYEVATKVDDKCISGIVKISDEVFEVFGLLGYKVFYSLDSDPGWIYVKWGKK